MTNPTSKLAALLANSNSASATPPFQPPTVHTGVVQVVNADGTFTITLDGGSANLPASVLGSVDALVGDTIVVLVMGTVLLVLGTIATAQSGGGSVPLGTVLPHSGSTAPPGYVLARGQAISRTTYSRLNALYLGLSYPYGAGDGSTTFNVPDLRDRVPIGAGNTYVIGNAGGASSVTLLSANLPSHTHSFSATVSGISATSTVTDPTHVHPTGTFDFFGAILSGGAYDAAAGSNMIGYSQVAAASTGITVSTSVSGGTASGTTGATGSGTAFSILPPYLALNFIVKC